MGLSLIMVSPLGDGLVREGEKLELRQPATSRYYALIKVPPSQGPNVSHVDVCFDW